MLVRFLSCRERFRLRYILGLEPYDRWHHTSGYGNMWHVCEEAHAKERAYWGNSAPAEDDVMWAERLVKYVEEMSNHYPTQREDLFKWYNICRTQFPEYVKYWADHPDVKCRQPLLQEQVFDVPYHLPSGRVVRLRGKFDSVDMITDEVTGPNGGVYLQENKTKGDIDQLQIERQLRFDLQTMMYLVALHHHPSCDIPRTGHYRWGAGKGVRVGEYPIMGVRYNVVRRPLSGGRGNIRPHAAKATKTKFTPAESDEEFYERLRRDYIAADPDYWFFRVRCEVVQRDIDVFKQTCLDPLLEHLCCWYERITQRYIFPSYDGPPDMHYRTPFGVYSALEEGGATEYDAYLDTGSEVGLRRTNKLFVELQ